MNLKIIYEDENVLVVDKPAGIVVFPEGKTKETTLIDILLNQHPELKNAGEEPRYGIVHRLDKDTSGILLVAKNTESLIFLQNQFKTRTVQKKYLCLVIGCPKSAKGKIETLIARDKKTGKKQKIILPNSPESKRQSARQAITEYQVLKKFKNYSLLEVVIKTGRKHQIRAHLAYLGHPIARDKLYGFKNQSCPKDLNRQFLHASYLKIKLPDGKIKEFQSKLPEDIQKVLKVLNSR